MTSITYDAATSLGTIDLPFIGGGPGEDAPIPDHIEIQFQNGSVPENGVNGVQNEQVIELLTIRLRVLNSQFPCRENSIAITKLDEALLWLQRRTAIRVEQGVEGKNEAYTS